MNKNDKILLTVFLMPIILVYSYILLGVFIMLAIPFSWNTIFGIVGCIGFVSSWRNQQKNEKSGDMLKADLFKIHRSIKETLNPNTRISRYCHFFRKAQRDDPDYLKMQRFIINILNWTNNIEKFRNNELKGYPIIIARVFSQYKQYVESNDNDGTCFLYWILSDAIEGDVIGPVGPWPTEDISDDNKFRLNSINNWALYGWNNYGRKSGSLYFKNQKDFCSIMETSQKYYNTLED